MLRPAHDQVDRPGVAVRLLGLGDIGACHIAVAEARLRNIFGFLTKKFLRLRNSCLEENSL